MKFSNSIMWLLFLLLALSVIFWIVDNTASSSADDIKNVIEKSAPSLAATQIVKDGLSSTPVPTWSELRALRERVNETLAIELARKVTGDDSLKTPSSIKAVQDAKNAAIFGEFYERPSTQWLLRALALALVLALGLRLFAMVRR
jgi:hypothetical protein